MNRFIIYTRVSTQGKQAENTSQHVQKAACMAYGEEQQWIFAGWIHDTQSAVKWDERTGITELKELAATGEITDVVFYRIDRTGRDSEVKSLIEYLYKHKVRVSLSHKSRTYETAYSCIQDNFWELAVSEYERNTTIERTFSGKIYQFRNNGMIGKPITGYSTRKIYREVDGKRVKITEPFMETIKQDAIKCLFETFIATKSEIKTSREINSKYPDVLQRTTSINRNLSKILSNAPLYAGLPFTERFMEHTREFSYPAVIDLETASKIAAYLSTYTKKYSDNVTPFNGVVTCSCGKKAKSRFSSQGDGTYSYSFVCKDKDTYLRNKSEGSNTDKPKCNGHLRVSYVIKALNKFFSGDESEQFISSFEIEITKQLEKYNTRLSDMERLKDTRSKLETQKLNIMESISSLAGNPEFMGVIRNFAQQVADIDKELASVSESIKKVNDSISKSTIILNRIGVDLEHFQRPKAITLDDKRILVEYKGKEHYFKNMYEYQTSEIRQDMKDELYNSRVKPSADKLRERADRIMAEIENKNWAFVTAELSELGVRITVPLAEQDLRKRRAGVRVAVDFTPLKSALS